LLDNLRHFFHQHQLLFKPGVRVLVACSGGPDSTALAWALHSMAPEFGFTCFLGHVNHQLRGRASDIDEAFVARQAASLQWRLARASAPVLRRGNLEERARVYRYKALKSMARKFRCAVILTAHTLDDQAETMLLRLFRGTGVDGLAGISPVRLLDESKIWLARPMLSVPKSEVLGYLKRIKKAYRIDRTNKNFQFTRNWVRGTLLPLINKRAPGASARLAVLAEIVRDEKQVWEMLASSAQRRCARSYKAGTLLDLKSLNRYSAPLQRRVLRRVVDEGTLTFDLIESTRQWMNAPPTQGRFRQLRRGWMIERLSKSQGAPSARLFWITKKA
jgi:tRNA(Ile)-lysidine synthase